MGSKTLGYMLREFGLTLDLVERQAAIAKQIVALARELDAMFGLDEKVVPAGNAAQDTTRPPAKKRGKRLQCPRCERTFAPPLPMARHLVATHKVKKKPRKKRKR